MPGGAPEGYGCAGRSGGCRPFSGNRLHLPPHRRVIANVNPK